ncbi:MAG: hypothetical protein GX288_04440 [Clostridiales bacterium]|nr:hypothetical protein [Clostridiales bacterium]
MISLIISEVKSFMAKLLVSDTFDHYLVREMELQTFTNFHISGLFNEEFYSKEEVEERGNCEYVKWGELRSIAFSMIKGNKTPLLLKIVFQLPDERAVELAQKSELSNDNIGGLYINIRFEKNQLRIITGTAIKTFTMDKTFEREWDMEVKNYLKLNNIIFEEE